MFKFFIIKNSKEIKFFYSYNSCCFQAILDVISLASIIPLIFLIQEDLVNQNLNNYINKFGLDAQFLLVKDDLYMYLPVIVILIIIVSTIFRIFLLYKTNNFIENIRHSISNKLMDKYIYDVLKHDGDTAELRNQYYQKLINLLLLFFNNHFNAN